MSSALTQQEGAREKAFMPNSNDPQDQTNTPAEPVTPAETAPQGDQTAPEAEQQTPDPTQEPTLTPDEAPQEAPTQTRQERRDQEAAARGISKLNQNLPQDQPFNQPAGGYPNSPQFDLRQYADVEGNLDVERANAAVVQTAGTIAQLEVQQQLDRRDAVHNFERDQDAVLKFDELNPDTPSYTPELDEAIAQEYQERAFRVVGYDNQGRPITQLDKSVRLADIAKRHVTSARAYAQKLNSNTNAAVAASADSAAPRPTASTPTEKKVEDMSVDEIRAKYGYHRT